MRVTGAVLAAALVVLQPVYRITDTTASSADIATALVNKAVEHRGPVLAAYDGRFQEIYPTPAYIDTQIVPLINNLLGRPLWGK